MLEKFPLDENANLIMCHSCDKPICMVNFSRWAEPQVNRNFYCFKCWSEFEKLDERIKKSEAIKSA